MGGSRVNDARFTPSRPESLFDDHTVHGYYVGPRRDSGTRFSLIAWNRRELESSREREREREAVFVTSGPGGETRERKEGIQREEGREPRNRLRSKGKGTEREKYKEEGDEMPRQARIVRNSPFVMWCTKYVAMTACVII